MDVMHDEASPVFIVGATRSGTTLLRLMVDHHPELCNFGEFEYAVHEIEGTQLPSMGAYYKYLDIDRMYRAKSWEIDPSLDYVSLVRSFLQQAIDRTDKPIGGATVHTKFDKLPLLWPNARYVHIIRDPRDVSRSCIGMGWVGNVWYGTHYWMDPVERWQRLSDQVPAERRTEIRFEDLIHNTEAELSRICEFMGTTYHPAMMNYVDNSRYTLPEPGLTEQWKKKLSADEIRWVESVCHAPMQSFGYEPVSETPIPPSIIEKLKLATQHRVDRIRRNIRRYGLAQYASWQFAKRLPYGRLKRRIISEKNNVDQSRLK